MSRKPKFRPKIWGKFRNSVGKFGSTFPLPCGSFHGIAQHLSNIACKNNATWKYRRISRAAFLNAVIRLDLRAIKDNSHHHLAKLTGKPITDITQGWVRRSSSLCRDPAQRPRSKPHQGQELLCRPNVMLCPKWHF